MDHTNTNEHAEILQLVEKFNHKRKSNKGKWFTTRHLINNEIVRIKCFDTWIQLLQFEGPTKMGSKMNLNVTEVNQWLTDKLTSYFHNEPINQ
jgi:hypothetical protein|tara:strand:+ start:686 stop:964 length:279 start_codon:yes stop_codon:yes gene_type:complete